MSTKMVSSQALSTFAEAIREIAQEINLPRLDRLAVQLEAHDSERLEAAAVEAVRYLWAMAYGRDTPCPAWGCQAHPRASEFLDTQVSTDPWAETNVAALAQEFDSYVGANRP